MRRLHAPLSLVLLLACTLGAHELRAQAPAIDTTALLAALRTEMTEGRVPGAAIAVVQDGRIILARGLGVRNVETRDSMTAESLVRIGSVTKSFTGLATLLLEQRGSLSRTAPIGALAPDLSPALRPLTLQRLLTHTAGMTDEGAGNGAQDDEALARRVMSWGSPRLFTVPDEVYSYSSPGYWLAGYVVERAARRPYADAMDSLVFRPLGMRRTTLRPTVAMTHPFATDHRVGTDGVATVIRPYPNDVATWPSGSIFSSATDLARYAIALLEDGVIDSARVLPAGVARAMLTGVAPVPGGECSYALGLAICMRGTTTTAGHYGFRGGSGAVLTLVPEKRLGIVILANRGGAIMGATEDAFLRMAGVVDEPGPARCNTARAASARRELVGTYVQATDTMRVTRLGDGIGLEYHAPPVRLADEAGGLVAVDAEGCAVMRVRVVEARGGRIYLHNGMHAYVRVRP